MVLLMAVESDADVTVEVLTWTLDAVAADADYTVSPTDAVTVAINPRGAVSLPVVYVTAAPDTIEERAQARITIHAVPAPAAPLTIPFTISGAGITPADYTLSDFGNAAVASPIIVPVGVESVPLILTAADDADTIAQTLNFLLTAPAAGAGYMLNAVNAAPVTITPSLASPLTVEFDRADVSIKEAAAANPDIGGVAFNVVLSDLPRGSVEVPVVTRDGTATAGTDYTAISRTLTFTGSTLSQRVMIELADDDVYEGNETFTVEFGDLSGSGVTAGAVSVVTVTIDNDDAKEPELAISVSESVIGTGRSSTGITITVTNGVTPPANLPVNFSTSGTATRDDYTLTLAHTGRNIAASLNSVPLSGSSTGLRMQVVADGDGDETATFTLEDGIGYTVSSTAGSATVEIQGQLEITFRESALTVNENAGTFNVRVAAVDVDVGGPSTDRVDMVTLRIPLVVTGTTTAGEDYPASLFTAEINVGSSQGEMSISVIDDAIYEDSETLIVSFGDLSGSGMQPGFIPRLTVTITDNDALSVSFVNAAQTVAEDAGTVNLVLRPDHAPGSPVTFTVSTAPQDPAATVAVDYMLPTSVTLDAGATSALLPLTLVNDRLAEEDERFALSLTTSAARVTPPADPAVITIVDDEIELSVTATPSTIGRGGTSTITITADPAPSRENLTIPFRISGAGISAADYTLTAGSTTFPALTGNVILPASQASVELTLTAADDAYTPTEMLVFRLAGSVDYAFGATDRVTVTIDPRVVTPPVVPPVGPLTAQFADAALEVAENGGTVEVTVQLSTSLATAITIPVMTTAGTATAGSDYTALSGAGATVTFAANATGAALMQTVSIPISDDTLYEADETFTVEFGSLAGTGGVTAGPRDSVTVTIADDDTLTITGFSAATMLVDEGAGTVNVDVAFGAALPAPLELKYTWSAGTATLVDDFDPVHLQRALLSNTGATGFRIRAAITDDGIAENDETIFIDLSAAPNVTITNPRLTIMIGDDDSLSAGMVGFTTDAVNVEENAGTVNVSLRLGAASGSAITIPIVTANGTAEAGEDYTALSGAATMVTFAAGVTMQTVSIPITDDIALEDPETFTVSLGSLPSGTTAGARTSVTVTIINLTRTVQFSETMVEVAENAGTVVLTAELSAVTPAEIVIDAFTSWAHGDGFRGLHAAGIG